MLALLLLPLLPDPTLGFGTLCGNKQAHLTESDLARLQKGDVVPPPNTKVAFVGDIGPTDSVLQYIHNASTDFLLIAGDFDYTNNPQGFLSRLDAIFPLDFPIFAAIGNHDFPAWNTSTQYDPLGYGQRFKDRLIKSGVYQYCVDSDPAVAPGISTVCNYKGITFVLSGVGTMGVNHAEYMDSIFTNSNSIWKHATWHKNQRLMQLNTKQDETGWAVYEICRLHGAFISTGHEHSYCRTKNMARYSQSPLVANDDPTIRLKRGQNSVWVSGLGGRDVRDWNETLRSNPWWASAWAANNGAKYSATLCTFHINNDPRQAVCDHIDYEGRVMDHYNMTTELDGPTGASALSSVVPCVAPFAEMPVSGSSGDLMVDLVANSDEAQPQVIRHMASEPVLTVAGHQGALLRFDVAAGSVSPKDAGSVSSLLAQQRALQSAHIQLFGVEGTGATDLLIQGVLGESREALQLTQEAVHWTLEDYDEEWEASEVWNSPCVASIVREVLSAQPGATSVTLLVRAANAQAAPRAFYSYDHSVCFAPHLTLEFEAPSPRPEFCA